MAKLIKTKKYGGEECAVEVGKDLYMTQYGDVFNETDAKSPRNVDPNVRAAFITASEVFKKKKKLENEHKKKEAEYQKKAKEIDDVLKSSLKKIRSETGILTLNEFKDAFYNYLPDSVKEKMERSDFKVKIPCNYGYDYEHIYISKEFLIGKYMRHLPFFYEEYDGCWFMTDDAEKTSAYKQYIKKYHEELPVKLKSKEYLSCGDKISLWYGCCYEIPIKKTRTDAYAKELAKKFAE